MASDHAFRRAAKAFGAIWPGLLLAGLIASAAMLASDQFGGPTLLFALLLGISAHSLFADSAATKGIDFASRQVLNIGVAFLGARIGLDQIAALGASPLAAVGVGVILTVLVGVALARMLRQDARIGVLTGGATAICGASAALTIAAALPNRPDRDREVLFAVVAVTGLSTLAMIAYPTLVPLLGLNDLAAGLFLGGSIHNVPQAVGSGYIVSDEAGDVATLTKLFRVAMLAPIALGVAFLFAREATRAGGGARPSLTPPWFLTAFLILAAANSFGAIPEQAASALGDSSRWCLVTAIAAIGAKTALGELRSVGWRPMALILAETLFLAAFLIAALAILGMI